MKEKEYKVKLDDLKKMIIYFKSEIKKANDNKQNNNQKK